MKDRLNYQHLRYFWEIAKEGSLTAAARSLDVSASTISVQMKTFEEAVGHELFHRSGRSLQLTEIGTSVFTYADSIFATGRELEAFLDGRIAKGPRRFDVGVSHFLPKHVTWELLAFAEPKESDVHLVCRESSAADLMEKLLLHQVELILADAPMQRTDGIRLFNRLLGTTSVSWFASPELSKSLKKDFPMSLDGAPVLLPTTSSSLRSSLDTFCERMGVSPKIVAEFDDPALMKVAAARGLGAVALPGLGVDRAAKFHQLELLGEASGVEEHVYAITLDERLDHWAIERLLERSRELLG